VADHFSVYMTSSYFFKAHGNVTNVEVRLIKRYHGLIPVKQAVGRHHGSTTVVSTVNTSLLAAPLTDQ
jgi:hypothetical protein